MDIGPVSSQEVTVQSSVRNSHRQPNGQLTEPRQGRGPRGHRSKKGHMKPLAAEVHTVSSYSYSSSEQPTRVQNSNFESRHCARCAVGGITSNLFQSRNSLSRHCVAKHKCYFRTRGDRYVPIPLWKFTEARDRTRAGRHRRPPVRRVVRRVEAVVRRDASPLGEPMHASSSPASSEGRGQRPQERKRRRALVDPTRPNGKHQPARPASPASSAPSAPSLPMALPASLPDSTVHVAPLASVASSVQPLPFTVTGNTGVYVDMDAARLETAVTKDTEIRRSSSPLQPARSGTPDVRPHTLPTSYSAVAPTPGVDTSSLSDGELRQSGTVGRQPERGEVTGIPATSAWVLGSSGATRRPDTPSRFFAVTPAEGLDLQCQGDEDLQPPGTVGRHPGSGEETGTPATSAEVLESSGAAQNLNVDERMDQPISAALYRTGATPGQDPVPAVERAGEVPDRPLRLPNISDLASGMTTIFPAVNRVLSQRDRADPPDIESELQAFCRTADKMGLTGMPRADVLMATASYLSQFIDGKSLY